MTRGGGERERRNQDIIGFPGEMDPGLYAHHVAKCARKKDYSTRARARRAARVLSRRTGRRFRAYECRICGRWHVTSHPWK